ncbi:fibronectin type III domain-containing protein [Paenibacillus sp. 453mf]|uniref:fibronectin type III domain-containing protein n=1 Tax=Paenibacillus sp. 453mf TaxID=1761874 RepID=UPI0008E8D8D8|nr:fibronectin type III domain-containing protein [Paenibacillus sp. 453mf]SFT00450.1 hypothetical protein SAMN04488601_1194 [Paenibacillus sp. 453mf]
MKRKTICMLLILLIVLPLGIEKASAYPGGLLDGMSGHQSNGGTYTTALTDNNETTYARIWRGFTGVLTYTLPKNADINAMKINVKAMPNSALTIKFYNESESLIHSISALEFYKPGITELDVNIPSVKKITLDVGTSSNSTELYEFDVFGQYDLATPTNITVVPDVKQLNIRFDSIEEALSYNLYVDGAKHTNFNSAYYELKDLTPGKSYKIQLTAVYADGVESRLSAAVSGSPHNDLISPIVQAETAWNKLTISWDKPNQANQVSLFVNGNEVFKNSNSLSHEMNALPETEYQIYVTMIDSYGRTLRSETITVNTPNKPDDVTPPGQPKDFTAQESADRTHVKLNWSEGSETDLEGYNLYVELDEEYKLVNKDLIKGSSATYKPVEVGQTYRFKLVALDTSQNVSEPSYSSVTITELPSTDSEQQETSEYLLVTWTETPEAVGYRIYFNGRLVGSVGPDVFEFKVTKAMGYIPGALNNRAEVRPLFADGTEGGSNNGGDNSGIIDGALDFIGVGDMLDTSIEFLKIYSLWIILVLAVVFSPVLYGLVIKLLNYLHRKHKLNHRTGR